MTHREYATLTELMQGREPGSVKVRGRSWNHSEWIRPGRQRREGNWSVMRSEGAPVIAENIGPWLIISEDAPVADKPLDTLRLEIAGRVLAMLHDKTISWETRHAYALAEADALIAEARK